MGAAILNMLTNISLEHIPRLWQQNDILILICELDDYGTLATDHLDEKEKRDFGSLKTEYFRKRFIVSRMVLKSVLCSLTKEGPLSDISLCKDKNGRLHVRGHNELNICISYSGNVIFLAISKIELGIDAEEKRDLPLNNVSGNMKTEKSHSGRYLTDVKFLTDWTLKEAYCKFSNESIFCYLNKEPDIRGVYHSTYHINDKYVLTIVTGSARYAIDINIFEWITCV